MSACDAPKPGVFMPNEAVHGFEVYQRLRRLAHFLMKSQSASHTLEPTALVNESLLRIARSGSGDGLSQDRFMALASTTMRRVLINHARERSAQKRQNDGGRDVTDCSPAGTETLDALLDLEGAMVKLAEVAPRQAAVAELHYFGGHPTRAIASLLDISHRSVQLDLRTARAYLQRCVTEDSCPTPTA